MLTTSDSMSTNEGSPNWRNRLLKRRGDKQTGKAVFVLMDLAVVVGLMLVASSIWTVVTRASVVEAEAVKKAGVVAAAVVDSKVKSVEDQQKQIKQQQASNTRAITVAKLDKSKILAEHTAIKKELEMCRSRSVELEARLARKSKELDSFRQRVYEVAASARGAAYNALSKVKETRHEVGLKP